MESSQRLGVMIMLATVFEMVLFMWAFSRRSYLALAIPVGLVVGALNVLAFWIGWTMFTASDEDGEFEEALEEPTEVSAKI